MLRTTLAIYKNTMTRRESFYLQRFFRLRIFVSGRLWLTVILSLALAWLGIITSGCNPPSDPNEKPGEVSTPSTQETLENVSVVPAGPNENLIGPSGGTVVDPTGFKATHASDSAAPVGT